MNLSTVLMAWSLHSHSVDLKTIQAKTGIRSLTSTRISQVIAAVVLHIKKGGLTNRLKVLFLNREKDCYNCPFINSCIEPSAISKYDKKKWEHTYVAPDGKGFVVTEKERIEEGRTYKNEAAKFQKELHMCKVAADNGHEIQFLKGTGRKVGQTYDIILDSLPTDLKST